MALERVLLIGVERVRCELLAVDIMRKAPWRCSRARIEDGKQIARTAAARENAVDRVLAAAETLHFEVAFKAQAGAGLNEAATEGRVAGIDDRQLRMRKLDVELTDAFPLA